MSASEDFWDDIVGHLKQGVLLPVVGPELLKIADGARQVTLSRIIGERVAERYQLAVDWNDRSGLDDAVRAFLVARPREESERLYRVINDILSNLNPAPPESLRQLAGIADLRLFVSTTFDSLLARAVNDVRFAGEPLTRELWFSPNQSTVEQQKNARPPAPDEAIVFKLFGQASSTPQYAIHDEDVLEWLHALLTDTARLPEWLAYQLKENPLLFLGCQTSDWIGRLMVRMASNTRLSLAAKQFFIVGTGISSCPSLAEFFRTYCGTTRVQILETDPAAFVAELYDRWLKRTPQRTAQGTGATQSPAAARGSIFISYVREDIDAARRLYEAISGIGGDVWLDDKRLQPGDRWDETILASIRREIRLFVPLISKHTERREEGYVFREWGEAVTRGKGIPRRRFIVPIIIDDEYDGNPAHYRQMPEAFREFHMGRAPSGKPDPELIATLTEEIRAMRRQETA